MLRGLVYCTATYLACPLSLSLPPLLPLPPPLLLPFGAFSLLAIALVSCAIWSDMALICVANASVDAFVLSRMLAVCSSCLTAACAIPAMYWQSSLPRLALVAWFALIKLCLPAVPPLFCL
jgi:hypothetical protein